MHPSTRPTNRYTTPLWASVSALAVCSWLTTGCHTATPRSAEVVADSVSGFSGKQGSDGWFYGYWDRTADADKRYSQTTDFQWLRHFGGDLNHPDFSTGKRWTLKDDQYFTSLWAEGGGPNGTWEGGTRAKVEHWAVRRWVSSVDGPVTIGGEIAKILPWGGRDSGRVHVVVDGATVYSAALASGLDWSGGSVYIGGTNYSVNATVHIGSLVDFLISPGPTEAGGASGPVRFTASIQAAPPLR